MAYPWKYPLLLAWVLALLSACHNESDSTESARYYYLDSLALSGTGQVYVYQPVNHLFFPAEIWHKRFAGDGQASYLYSTMLASDGDTLQKTVEKLVSSGSTLTSMELLYHHGGDTILSSADSVMPLRVRIIHPTTFLFGPPDSTVAAKYQIEYNEPRPDSIRVILTRMRRYTGNTTWTFKGQVYPALVYTVDETLETETEGFTTSEWQTTEIYARGFGLVYYRKAINDETVLEYELREIVPYETYLSQH